MAPWLVVEGDMKVLLSFPVPEPTCTNSVIRFTLPNGEFRTCLPSMPLRWKTRMLRETLPYAKMKSFKYAVFLKR